MALDELGGFPHSSLPKRVHSSPFRVGLKSIKPGGPIRGNHPDCLGGSRISLHATIADVDRQVLVIHADLKSAMSNCTHPKSSSFELAIPNWSGDNAEESRRSGLQSLDVPACPKPEGNQKLQPCGASHHTTRSRGSSTFQCDTLLLSLDQLCPRCWSPMVLYSADSWTLFIKSCVVMERF